MDLNLLKNILRSYHIRVTDTRLQVLDVLLHSESALCHHEIAASLEQYHIDKVTIYRTLDVFEKNGLIHKIATKDRNWQYAIRLKKEQPAEVDQSHAHFICNRCGRIFCMPVTGYNQQPDENIINGFRITEKELRFHGLCPDCDSSNKTKNQDHE